MLVLFYKGVAYGKFTDSLFQTGWGILQIKTNKLFSDPVQMYAAGWLEGTLTADQIYPHFQNIYNLFFGKNSPSMVKITNLYFKLFFFQILMFRKFLTG